MALGIIAWWLFVYRLFTARIAWISSALLAFMPMYWQQALSLTNYPLAFLFLFCSFAAFAWLYHYSRVGALIVSGLFFGLSIAAKDAFLVFVPWYVIAYLWILRRDWKVGVGHIVLFFVCTGLVYLAPYMGDIQKYGYPINQNLARVWPTMSQKKVEIENGSYLHLYPDPYTYYKDKERFNTEYMKQYETYPLIQKWQDAKVLVSFGVGNLGFFASLLSGFWIFLNSIPSFFQQALIGTVALWLFIIPGFLWLYREKRSMAWLSVGLVITMYININLVLHYEREHLMDIMWLLSLLAALGISTVSESLSRVWKVTTGTLLCCILGVLLFQELQANRLEFAKLYTKNPIEKTLSAAKTLESLPETSVVAVALPVGEWESLRSMADRTSILFQEETVNRLIAEKKITDAFKTYGVTHVMGYSSGTTLALQKALPQVQVVSVSHTTGKPQVTPFTQYLLHILK